MNEEDTQLNSSRSLDGEKFIEESVEGPYQFAEDDSAEEITSLPNGTITVRSTMDELLDAMAALIFTEARVSVKKYADFQLAVSNSQALYSLYERLMYDPNVRGIPWQCTHLWCVEDNAYSIVKDTIVDHADVPVEQVHYHLPECVDGEDTSRIDCLVIDHEASVPENIMIQTVVVVVPTVELCESFARTCEDITFRGFVLQENP